MVTTFSPPTRAKKSTKKNPALPLYIVIGVLVAGVLALGVLWNKAATGSKTMQGSVLQVAESLGVEGVTAESLADPAAAPLALESLAAKAAEAVQQAATAGADRDRVQADATRLTAEAASMQQQLTSATDQIDRLRSDAKSATEEFAELKKRYDEETSRLTAQVTALTAQVAGLEESLAAARSAAPVVLEGDADTVLIEAEAPAAADVDEPAVADAPATEPAADAEATDAAPAASAAAGGSRAFVVPEGGSILFKTVRFDGDTGKLTFLTVDDRVLTYKDVDAGTFESLVAAPTFDIFYRFRILDVFASEPLDRDLLPTIRR
jgi:hypothetical protein